jgi:hypothetical protein
MAVEHELHLAKGANKCCTLGECLDAEIVLSAAKRTRDRQLPLFHQILLSKAVSGGKPKLNQKPVLGSEPDRVDFVVSLCETRRLQPFQSADQPLHRDSLPILAPVIPPYSAAQFGQEVVTDYAKTCLFCRNYVSGALGRKHVRYLGEKSYIK